MSGRKLRFREGDGWSEEERARLIAFIGRYPFQIVAPLRWRCDVPGCDPYEIRDTGGQYVVQQMPFLGRPITLARIGNVGHRDDGWIRAVVMVMEHAEAGGMLTLVAGKEHTR